MRRYTDARYDPYIRTRIRCGAGLRFRVKPAVIGFVRLARSVLCLFCLVIALNGMLNNFQEAIEKICEYKVAQLVNEYIDRAVLEATAVYPEKDLVEVVRNPQGKVTSVETDAMGVNRFAALLSESILRQLKEKETEEIKAPFGALSGNGLLSSMGFSIPCRIIPAGKVTVSPLSGFSDAGMNQTVHRLQMDVSVYVRILFPLMKREEAVKRTVIISETVIIGDVPDTLLTGYH